MDSVVLRRRKGNFGSAGTGDAAARGEDFFHAGGEGVRHGRG